VPYDFAPFGGQPRRHFTFALVLGFAVHAAILLYAASQRAAALPLPPAIEAADALRLVPVPQVVEDSEVEPGGGSPSPGREEVAEGMVPEPVAVPAAVVAPTPEPKAPPKVRSGEQEAPRLDHGNTESTEPTEDLFALDELLTATEGDEVEAAALKPRPVFRSKTSHEFGAAAMTGRLGVRSRSVGTGPGSNGGLGGNGSGKSAQRPTRTVFGGTSGAFLGQVCFIDKGTTSIRAIGDCVGQVALRTDEFNIRSTFFKDGFPGIEARTEWFAILYTGTFRVAESGRYRFRLASDDGSILQIDGKTVVDNDGQHAPLARRGSIKLEAGEHELRLRYFQGPGFLLSLQLWVKPPNGRERLFGPSF